jgi:hypothetical protein
LYKSTNILDIKSGDIIEVKSGDVHLSRHIILYRYLDAEGGDMIVSFAIFVDAEMDYMMKKLNTIWEMDLVAYTSNNPDNEITIL